MSAHVIFLKKERRKRNIREMERYVPIWILAIALEFALILIPSFAIIFSWTILIVGLCSGSVFLMRYIWVCCNNKGYYARSPHTG